MRRRSHEARRGPSQASETGPLSSIHMAGQQNGSSLVLDRGVLVVSIDTELSWGLVHHGTGAGYDGRSERQHIDRLLDLMDTYEIPTTWAIVGHLFLDSCAPVDGVKHPEIVRPDYEWMDGDWFDQDPCLDLQRAPTWYAPDLVDRILASNVPHEIASHSFSHVVVGDPGCSEACLDSELKACRALAEARGIQLDSMIFPTNSVGHLDVVRRNGFLAYRSRRPALPPASALRSRVRKAADQLVPRVSSAAFPEYSDGLWNLPQTLKLLVEDGGARGGLKRRQLQRRLHQAVRLGALFHPYFHPCDLTPNPELAFGTLDRLFREAARLRDAGKLETLTMGALAQRLEQERLVSDDRVGTSRNAVA